MILFKYFIMKQPTAFGWFHIMWICIIIVSTFLLCRFFGEKSEKKLKKLLIITSCIMLCFELYKQLTFSWDIFNPSVGYNWYAFPFQFCSTPMYVMMLAGISKNPKVRNSLLAYLATYSLIAGAGVYIYPGDVFTIRVGINFQTMIHHGTQVIIGLFLLINGIVKPNLKTWISSLIVFGVMVSIALALDIIVPITGINNGGTFNMFFISPFFNCTLPVIGLLHQTPIGSGGFNIFRYLLFVLIYFIGFSLGSLIVIGLSKLINKCKKN